MYDIKSIFCVIANPNQLCKCAFNTFVVIAHLICISYKTFHVERSRLYRIAHILDFVACLRCILGLLCRTCCHFFYRNIYIFDISCHLIKRC